jgi:putative SOS response-associated peptidase YedK
MCGRYTLTSHEQIAEDLQSSLDVSVTADPWWKPRFNVAPTQPAPVVRVHRDGARTIELMRWGLVPHWAEPGGKKPPLMINARVESLTAKQMFRDALERKRCLVPADGFFEWVSGHGAARGAPARGDKTAPRPFYFHPRTHQLIAFAGLWARSRDAAGNELHSFTIITTRASDLVRPIHDRMPIVLPPDDHAAWLDPALDIEAARALLGHPAGDDWVRKAVSTWVNKADHDDPQCIAPDAAEPASKQQRLFD